MPYTSRRDHDFYIPGSQPIIDQLHCRNRQPVETRRFPKNLELSSTALLDLPSARVSFTRILNRLGEQSFATKLDVYIGRHGKQEFWCFIPRYNKVGEGNPPFGFDFRRPKKDLYEMAFLLELGGRGCIVSVPIFLGDDYIFLCKE